MYVYVFFSFWQITYFLLCMHSQCEQQKIFAKPRVPPLRRQFRHPQKPTIHDKWHATTQSIHNACISIIYQPELHGTDPYNISHSMRNQPSKDCILTPYAPEAAICFFYLSPSHTHTQKQPRLRVNNVQRTRLYLHITLSPPISLISEEKRWIKQRKTAGNGDQWILLNCMPSSVLCLVGVLQLRRCFSLSLIHPILIIYQVKCVCCESSILYTEWEKYFYTLKNKNKIFSSFVRIYFELEITLKCQKRYYFFKAICVNWYKLNMGIFRLKW